MEKRDALYSGKAKSVYATDNPQELIICFRNDTSAFDGKKIEQLDRKGQVNNQFNAYIMNYLAGAGIETHFIQMLSPQESLVKRLTMMPLECVVRNMTAGSICRRLGIQEGMELTPPTFEFFLKNDELGDPMVNEYHIHSFGWASVEQVERMKALTFQVNAILKELFAKGKMLLVDYKLEFGIFEDRIILGDEFTPDGCRLWDIETRTKLDKDRFRQGLGGVVEAYEEVGHRLGIQWIK